MNHFLNLIDWPASQLQAMLTQAVTLKQQLMAQGRNLPVLSGKVLALIFQKPSLRTRISFELAMQHLGGHAIYLSSHEIKLGERESIPDVARVLGGYVDGIVARVYDHAQLIQMSQWSPVPIINGLSPYAHPCQAMADALTIYEEFGKIEGIKVAYFGNSDNDVTRSLLFAAARFNFELIISSPPQYTIDSESLDAARAAGAKNIVTIEPNPELAVKQADVIYTDTWIATNKGAEAEKLRHIFMPYQVNQTLIDRAPKHAIVMHCMPAIRGQEITDEAADGPNARLIQQANNRLHAQKPVLAHLLR